LSKDEKLRLPSSIVWPNVTTAASMKFQRKGIGVGSA